MQVQEILQNPFPLAPMDGFTHSLFRRFMRRLGCGFVVSEFIPAATIRSTGRTIIAKWRYQEEERPYGIQMYGADNDSMVDAAKFIQDAGADFVDINFGCPVRSIVSRGKGSAWLTKPLEMSRLLEEVRAAIKIPLSIKIRTGFDRENADEILKIAENSGVDWIVVHGRTRDQGYKAPINWDYLGALAAKARIPFFANGDVREAYQARSLMQQYPFKGLMIGRASLLDPLVFLKLQNAREDIRTLPRLSECLSLLIDLIEEESALFDRPAFQLAKFTAAWAQGYSHAREWRAQLFRAAQKGGTLDDVATIVHQHLELVSTPQLERHPIEFLMAGHG